MYIYISGYIALSCWEEIGIYIVCLPMTVWIVGYCVLIKVEFRSHIGRYCIERWIIVVLVPDITS